MRISPLNGCLFPHPLHFRSYDSATSYFRSAPALLHCIASSSSLVGDMVDLALRSDLSSSTLISFTPLLILYFWKLWAGFEFSDQQAGVR